MNKKNFAASLLSSVFCTKFVVRVFPDSMKTSAFIFLFLLVSSLSSAMDSGVRSGSQAYPGTFQTTAGFSVGSRYADFLAAESVRTAIPAPMHCASSWTASSGSTAEAVTFAPGGISRWCRTAVRNTSFPCCRAVLSPFLSITPIISNSVSWSFSRQILLFLSYDASCIVLRISVCEPVPATASA